MTGRSLSNEHPFDEPVKGNLLNQQSLQLAQDVIYKFLKYLVDNYSPEIVLQEFQHLFFEGYSTVRSDEAQSLYQIILNNNEDEFQHTFKRACYILINNWSSQRHYNSIQAFIQLLAKATTSPFPHSPSLRRLRTWIANFVNTDDYKELQLFDAPDKGQERDSWIHRYTSYLLVPQYLDSRNPVEQRELAKTLSRKLREKFKLELAMYTARCNSDLTKDREKELTNPTKLGDGVIDLVKEVISRTTLCDYTDQAHIFLQQTRELNYKAFKQSLQNYLVFSFSHFNSLGTLQTKLAEKLDNLYENYHAEQLNVDLLLRTSRQIIEWLTMEDGQEPSSLFILLTTQENTLTLAVILLKIILICQYVRTHLEVCIAKLIQFYEKYPENECQWFIEFLEVFNLVFTIYAENVQYNLVKVKENHSDNQQDVDLDRYRVFSQLKGADLRGNDLSGVDIHGADLSAADLRDANLRSTDLSQADLSLSKLSRANLNGAILNEAELIAADLNSADLSNTQLIATKLRHADLRQANLSSATLRRASLHTSDLSGANLQDADLQYADLSKTNLSYANLSNANLQYADLSKANLICADLRNANLEYAKLGNANLRGANLTEANLSHANLEQVNLRGADLKGATVRRAVLAKANLSHANLSRTDLSLAQLSEADLSDSDLSDALLRHVNFSGANLTNANLTGANLFSANLNGAKMENAQFGNNTGL